VTSCEVLLQGREEKTNRNKYSFGIFHSFQTNMESFEISESLQEDEKDDKMVEDEFEDCYWKEDENENNQFFDEESSYDENGIHSILDKGISWEGSLVMNFFLQDLLNDNSHFLS
jgi:hypothetical protein